MRKFLLWTLIIAFGLLITVHLIEHFDRDPVPKVYQYSKAVDLVRSAYKSEIPRNSHIEVILLHNIHTTNDPTRFNYVPGFPENVVLPTIQFIFVEHPTFPSRGPYKISGIYQELVLDYKQRPNGVPGYVVISDAHLVP